MVGLLRRGGVRGLASVLVLVVASSGGYDGLVDFVCGFAVFARFGLVVLVVWR